MKLFPAKCHERATLRKLWRQTGNSSLLPTKCWLLLHVIAGNLSAVFKFCFCFVLFCYITIHLMTGPEGNSEFCFPRDKVEGNIEILGKQDSLFLSGPVIKSSIYHWKIFTIAKNSKRECFCAVSANLTWHQPVKGTTYSAKLMGFWWRFLFANLREEWTFVLILFQRTSTNYCYGEWFRKILKSHVQ